MFWGEPKLRYASSFHARHFVARYNYLTCMQNHAVLFVRELGRESRTVVAPSEDWISSLKITVDWDERNWHPEGTPGLVGESSAAPNTALPSSGAAAATAIPDKEEFWMKAPFGYYVLVDRDARNILEYFSWNQPSEDETEGAFFNRRITTAFHAWFATFPSETWRRLFRSHLQTVHETCYHHSAARSASLPTEHGEVVPGNVSIAKPSNNSVEYEQCH